MQLATDEEPLIQPLDLLRLVGDQPLTWDEADVLGAHAAKVKRGNRLPDTTRTVVLGR